MTVDCLVQHEAERQAWTHTPQAIHKHYALQACLLPTNTTLTPPTLAGWQAILVRPLAHTPTQSCTYASIFRVFPGARSLNMYAVQIWPHEPI